MDNLVATALISCAAFAGYNAAGEEVAALFQSISDAVAQIRAVIL
jgi:hypothetical protein